MSHATFSCDFFGPAEVAKFTSIAHNSEDEQNNSDRWQGMERAVFLPAFQAVLLVFHTVCD